MGYDVLLEKPVSPRPEEVVMLAGEAERLGRRVMVCHVLRYTPFYEKVKELVDAGRIGTPAAFHLSEGVGPWHQAHSYVRGHWSERANASPMILAKSCHDLDILSWLADRPCTSVASFGGLSFFTPEHRPEGAPDRCTDGCPVGDACPYNALHYLDRHRRWLGYVMDGADTATDQDIRSWLHTSPWGRCVYTCGNDVVDRQVLALEFEDHITATFTMTAFDTGRNLTILGTGGVLRGGESLRRDRGCDILIEPHHGEPPEEIRLMEPEGGYDGHMGGDGGLVSQLYHEMRTAAPDNMKSSLARSVESHLMAFAADRSRLERRIVTVEEFRSPKSHKE
jgi:predicted dehydrogenase